MFPFQEFFSFGATRRHRNMYLHQSQDPCLPQDRKRRQIHDTFCVPRNCKLQEKRGKLMLPAILIYIYIFFKNFSFIFIFSSLLDIRTLFEIYFWPCSINSRYMLQLPVLRHCFSSYKYNSHDLLLVLDIAQALAHLWANIDGFTFSYQTSEYQQICTSLSIPEVHCRNGLWRIMLAFKAPKITNFKVHNHFFKTVLPFLSFSLII